MNELIKQDKLTTTEAHDIYEQIVVLRKSINTSFWSLVEYLKSARDYRIWAVLGYDSWSSFLAQPEIDLNYRTVENYISIYKTVIEKLGDARRRELLLPFDIDITKLQVITPYITQDNSEELIQKAKTLSRSDLRAEIQDLGNKKLIAPQLPTGTYDVIYADPPWKYDFSSTGTRDIENNYPTLELFEIKQIQVPSSPNSVLFLWATAPKLREALEVMEAWGFEYKTHMIWDKQKIGMGYWFRGQHELLLVGTKGMINAPQEGARISSVYSEKRTEHSKKPNYFYSLIESYFPHGTYLELFARTTRDKWKSWGNQV